VKTLSQRSTALRHLQALKWVHSFVLQGRQQWAVQQLRRLADIDGQRESVADHLLTTLSRSNTSLLLACAGRALHRRLGEALRLWSGGSGSPLSVMAARRRLFRAFHVVLFRRFATVGVNHWAAVSAAYRRALMHLAALLDRTFDAWLGPAVRHWAHWSAAEVRLRYKAAERAVNSLGSGVRQGGAGLAVRMLRDFAVATRVRDMHVTRLVRAAGQSMALQVVWGWFSWRCFVGGGGGCGGGGLQMLALRYGHAKQHASVRCVLRARVKNVAWHRAAQLLTSSCLLGPAWSFWRLHSTLDKTSHAFMLSKHARRITLSAAGFHHRVALAAFRRLELFAAKSHVGQSRLTQLGVFADGHMRRALLRGMTTWHRGCQRGAVQAKPLLRCIARMRCHLQSACFEEWRSRTGRARLQRKVAQNFLQMRSAAALRTWQSFYRQGARARRLAGLAVARFTKRSLSAAVRAWEQMWLQQRTWRRRLSGFILRWGRVVQATVFFGWASNVHLVLSGRRKVARLRTIITLHLAASILKAWTSYALQLRESKVLLCRGLCLAWQIAGSKSLSIAWTHWGGVDRRKRWRQFALTIVARRAGAVFRECWLHLRQCIFYFRLKKDFKQMTFELVATKTELAHVKASLVAALNSRRQQQGGANGSREVEEWTARV
jgi:hypothetical protein